MSYNIIDILFVTISIIFGSIMVYVSYMTFCVDSDDEDIFDYLNVKGSVDSKKTIGGTSREEVKRQIKVAKNIIKEYEKN